MGHTYCDDHECHISISGYTLLWSVGFFLIFLIALAIYSTWLLTKSCVFWLLIAAVFVVSGFYIWAIVDAYT